MRKFLAIAFTIVMLLSAVAQSNALASTPVNSFSFRNGIEFLMSREEVIEIEKLSVPRIEDKSDWGLGVTIYGRFAGIDTVEGNYRFDNEDRMISFSYEFNPISTQRSLEVNAEEYGKIQKSLIEKYGAPFDVTTTSETGYEVSDSYKWLICVEDKGYIEIDHVLKNGADASGKTSVFHTLTYSWIPKENVGGDLKPFNTVDSSILGDL